MEYYSKVIREKMGEAKYVHGEIYADAVFGALLSAISDNELKMQIVDFAFEKYRKKAAMCVSLEREGIACDAMNTAIENGIGAAIKIHLGAEPDAEILTEYFERIKD